MKITSVRPFILHVPVTGSQIADSTHSITHWGVVGAQIGTRVGTRLKAEQLRILLSILVLSVSIKIGVELVLTPSELYSVAPGGLP